ncbi:chemotaxis protein CheW [Roseomonas sp. 18066]|uniref:chemotaxis protein CheW n=1 Tax=Roseomonas sp. 18066 TaxID=2681412 RepID=UPI00135ABB96|nr:chemotaxis protein CheW [Roseomonas sp. 18066]
MAGSGLQVEERAPEARAPEDRTLVFRAGGARHGLPAGLVAELARPGALTRVPRAPDSLLGLMHRRGAVLPVVSLPALLRPGAPPPSGAAARLLVLQGDTPCALLVEAVEGLAAADAAPPLDLPALLARDFLAMHRREAAEAAAPDPVPAAPAAPMLQLLRFALAGQEFCLPLQAVRGVARRPAGLVPLPGADAAMLGIIALEDAAAGSRLRPLVSLRRLLGLAGDPAAGERVILLAVAGAELAMPVDALRGVLRLPAAALDAVPPVLARAVAEARVAGLLRLPDGRLASLLDPARLLDAATLAALPAQPAAAGCAALAGGAVLLPFRLGAERYALPAAVVRGVLRRPAQLAPLPRAPDFIAGLLSWRGAALAVVDQRRRFGLPPGPEGQRLLVLAVNGVTFALAVEAVERIGAWPAAALRPAPPGLPALFDGIALALDGLAGDAPLLLLDPATLLAEAERDLLAALPRQAAATGAATGAAAGAATGAATGGAT